MNELNLHINSEQLAMSKNSTVGLQEPMQDVFAAMLVNADDNGQTGQTEDSANMALSGFRTTDWLQHRESQNIAVVPIPMSLHIEEKNLPDGTASTSGDNGSTATVWYNEPSLIKDVAEQTEFTLVTDIESVDFEVADIEYPHIENNEATTLIFLSGESIFPDMSGTSMVMIDNVGGTSVKIFSEVLHPYSDIPIDDSSTTGLIINLPDTLMSDEFMQLLTDVNAGDIVKAEDGYILFELFDSRMALTTHQFENAVLLANFEAPHGKVIGGLELPVASMSTLPNVGPFLEFSVTPSTNISSYSGSELRWQIIPGRLLTSSEIGNGYLSYLPGMDIQSSAAEAHVKPMVNSASGFGELQQTGKLSFHALAETNLSLLKRDSGEVAMLNRQSIQNSNNAGIQKQQSQQLTQGLLYDVAKWSTLLTSSVDGSTFYFRDFRLSDKESSSLKERLLQSSFFEQSNINKLVINGHLEWTYAKEEK